MGAGYQAIYGLTERAFETPPDARFHFPSLTQRKAMSAVSYGINRGAGIVALTGGEGLGKSILLAHLADQLAGQPVTLAWLAGGADALTPRVAEAFGLTPPEDDGNALAALEAFLLEESRRGQRALLVMDDAEALSEEAGAELAALAGLHHGERSLLQVVLAGNEDFAQRLAGAPDWSGVQGRTVASHHFEPMLRDEVEPYVRHRLTHAGWKGVPALDEGLAPLIFEATGGNPGAVNRAMSVLLDEAAAAGLPAVEGNALAAWLDGEQDPETAMQFEAQPEPVEVEADTASPAGTALVEAQIEAIEHAFAEHDRMLARLRRELADLRDRPEPEAPSVPSAPMEAEERLSSIEARLDQHEQALRHILERLILFFERSEPG